MHPNDAPVISDPVMQALLQMLKTNSDKASGVQEDALMAVGTLIEGLTTFKTVVVRLNVSLLFSSFVLVLGMNFCKYIEHFLPFLYQALSNQAEYQICSAAVGVVGDLSRSLLDKLTPYCDQIMNHLLICLNVSLSNERTTTAGWYSRFRTINCTVRSNHKSSVPSETSLWPSVDISRTIWNMF